MNWEPFHESHSIEVAAAVIAFSEPLTDIAWRKVVRAAEANCKAAGLTEKSAINSIQFTIAAGGVGVPTTPALVEGILFKRSAATEIGESGEVKSTSVVVAESLAVSRSSLNYQTTVYTRWNAFYERLNLLVRAPLREALHAVRIASLRLEYKDSFRHTGTGVPIAADLFNQKSALISPHVFNNENLWHSHTGFFEDADGCDTRLVQVNVDANTAMMQNGQTSFRAISITTAVQNNFSPLPEEDLDNEEDLVTFQLAMFDSLHIRSIDLFKQIISSEAAARVGMD